MIAIKDGEYTATIYKLVRPRWCYVEVSVVSAAAVSIDANQG